MRTPRSSTSAAIGLLVATATVVLPAPDAHAAAACTSTCVFDQPGRYIWTVPAGAHQVRISVSGAQGGAGALGPGGRGGRIDALVHVRPGQRLVVVVGGAGGPKVGGFNGGGAGGPGLTRLPDGGGGGGASDVRLSSSPDTRILVAGGGGGSATGISGSGSGGPTGGPGVGTGGGLGGTANSGGLNGPGELLVVPPVRAPQPTNPATPPMPDGCAGIGFSTPGVYSAGENGEAATLAGAGGGGGGFRGGGAGSQIAAVMQDCAYTVGIPGGPGGGGNGYADPAWCSDVHTDAGTREGDGLVVITPAGAMA